MAKLISRYFHPVSAGTSIRCKIMRVLFRQQYVGHQITARELVGLLHPFLSEQQEEAREVGLVLLAASLRHSAADALDSRGGLSGISIPSAG
jgi:hypothetical protein